MDLEGKWKAILIGGLITGLAPMVPLLHLACCLIPLAGAIVAVAIYSNSTPSPSLTNRDGVLLGVMSGLAGSLLYAVVVIPLVYFLGQSLGGFFAQFLPEMSDIPASMQPLVQRLVANFGSFLALIVAFKVLSQLGMSLVFGLLGGLLGVALFRRKATVP